MARTRTPPRDLGRLHSVGQQVRRKTQGLGTRVPVLEAPGVGHDARIETRGDVVVELDAGILQQECDDLCRRRCEVDNHVQRPEVVVTGMVIDIDAAWVLEGHPLDVAEAVSGTAIKSEEEIDLGDFGGLHQRVGAGHEHQRRRGGDFGASPRRVRLLSQRAERQRHAQQRAHGVAVGIHVAGERNAFRRADGVDRDVPVLDVVARHCSSPEGSTLSSFVGCGSCSIRWRIS